MLTPSLRCRQCNSPFSVPTDGLTALDESPFIESLLDSLKISPSDVNAVAKCGLCDLDEDATVHCVECNENLGPVCAAAHKRLKLTATHRQVSLQEDWTETSSHTRIPRCRVHSDVEVNAYCKTCSSPVCAQCVVEKHPKHDFVPLSQISATLRDKIIAFSINVEKREKAANKAIATMEGTISQIEADRSTAEKKIDQIFDSLVAAVEQRRQEVKQGAEQEWKKAAREKRDVEAVSQEFREFRAFTEGLLVQGTPFDIADSYEMVGSF